MRNMESLLNELSLLSQMSNKFMRERDTARILLGECRQFIATVECADGITVESLCEMIDVELGNRP